MRILADPVFGFKKALVLVGFRQQKVIQVRVPGGEGQNHRGALVLRILDKLVKRFFLLGGKRVEPFHMYAVERGAGFGGKGAHLVGVGIPEFGVIQHTAVRALDGGGLLVRVAVHRVKVNGVAIVIRHNALAAVL